MQKLLPIIRRKRHPLVQEIPEPVKWEDGRASVERGAGSVEPEGGGQRSEVGGRKTEDGKAKAQSEHR